MTGCGHIPTKKNKTMVAAVYYECVQVLTIQNKSNEYINKNLMLDFTRKTVFLLMAPKYRSCFVVGAS